MKTAISVPDATFARVEDAARRLGVSRSEFFARAAEHWLAALSAEELTAQIDDALSGVQVDTGFAARAAGELARRSPDW
jgi:metal-responsive CopG/Arc/MetJ family transcriptional regulator